MAGVLVPRLEAGGYGSYAAFGDGTMRAVVRDRAIAISTVR